MSKIPEFGKVVFQYIPNRAEDPFSRPMIAWKLEPPENFPEIARRWRALDLPNLELFDWLWLDLDPDEDQVLEAVSLLFRQMLQRVRKMQKLIGGADDEGSERRVDGEADEERDKETDAED